MQMWINLPSTFHRSVLSSHLRFLNRGHGCCATNAVPSGLSRRRFTSSAKSPSFPRLSGLELFASISHLREVRKVKLFRLELKPPILIIVALHIHLHHDKIAIFTRYNCNFFIYLFNIVIVLKIVNKIIVNIFFSKIFFISKNFWS